jgi:hypothetical protein
MCNKFPKKTKDVKKQNIKKTNYKKNKKINIKIGINRPSVKNKKNYKNIKIMNLACRFYCCLKKYIRYAGCSNVFFT